MNEFVNYGAPLSGEVEIRATALFSAVCLKSDPAVFVASSGGKAPAVAPASPKKAAAPAKAEVADDLDLFGDDDEEEAEALKKLNEKMEAEKKANKAGKGKGERSLIVLEVKPFDAETDLQAVAKGIKMIEHEGIQNWGKEHKLMPIAFGVNKLAISAVVYDDLMDIDGLCELINAKYENDIQSIDCQAMSKV
jgi:translation elongation factor EF-1beta